MKPPSGHGRCSFASRRGSPASSTLPPRHGARQFLSSARSIRTAAALWHGTGRMSARRRRVCASLAGIAPRATRPSACCPIVWRRGCRARSTCWKRLWWRPRAQGAWRRRRNEVRRDAIELPGAMRWVRRRVRLVHNALARVIGLIPDRLASCAATMGAVRERLGCDSALMALRGLVAEQLQMLPAPLGFQPHGIGVTGRKPAFQHRMGPDPPPVSA